MIVLGRIGAALLAALACCDAAVAQPADTVFLNGKIITYDGDAPAQALAVRGTIIAAVGRSEDMAALIGPRTVVVELAGRTVIPGLIDSHIHAIRAGLTYRHEVHWTGAASIAEALDRLRQAARTAPKGSWLIVAGGWVDRQFAESRRPTQAEIAAAAPDHHVYVQILYSAVLLSPGGWEALGVERRDALKARLKLDRDDQGRPTGWVSGDNRSISELFDLLPKPGFAQQVAGTRAFFLALNRAGVTGVIDPGGYNLPIAAYQPLFKVWRDGDLTVRVVYSLCAPRRGHERADFETLTAMLPMGLGDDWLRFNGIGENVTWGMYNNDAPSEAQKDELHAVLEWAAARRLTATFHWHNDRSVGHLLDVLERVSAATPIAPLRWSVAHLHDASRASLIRMQALGVGWLMQNAFYFRGESFLAQRGLEAAAVAPPIATGIRMGLPIGAGTDAHRVMNYNPFVAIRWMLDGRTVGGMPTRGPEEIPTRVEALRLYTQGSAWFAFDEHRRGSLAAGKLADLAVLSGDYLAMPVEEIGTLSSVLTMVGGRVVHAAAPYAPHLETRSSERPP
jgi:predicted amidohydrolase YtcJ